MQQTDYHALAMRLLERVPRTHDGGCPAGLTVRPRGCTCGLDELLADCEEAGVTSD